MVRFVSPLYNYDDRWSQWDHTKIVIYLFKQMLIFTTMLDLAVYKNTNKYLVLFNSLLSCISIVIAVIVMTHDTSITIIEILTKLTNINCLFFIVIFIFVNYWKGKTYLADHYEICLMFFKKHMMQQEHKAILDILSEAVITVELEGLTYFNRQAKKILYQCVEN